MGVEGFSPQFIDVPVDGLRDRIDYRGWLAVTRHLFSGDVAELGELCDEGSFSWWTRHTMGQRECEYVEVALFVSLNCCLDPPDVRIVAGEVQVCSELWVESGAAHICD